MTLRYRFACAFVALAMTACTANAGPSLPGGMAAAPKTGTSTHASLELRVRIPKRRRNARYVSPSTQSIRISQGSKIVGTFNTTPSSNGCTTVNGATLCAFKAGIVPGKHQQFTVNAYDAKGGAGNLLSTGFVVQTIVAGFNVIPITLDGIVTSISVAMQNPNVPAGAAAELKVYVMARDADGNTIVGPGSYTAPITLTDSDITGATTLAKSTVTGPGGYGLLEYASGSVANVTSATIGATATGVTKVTPATFAPTPIAVAGFTLPTSLGAVTNLSLAPDAIAAASDGNLWISATDAGHLHTALMKMTPSGSFSTFLPGAAPSTNLTTALISGLTQGSDGNIWYVANGSVGEIDPATGVANDYPFGSPTMSGFCPSGGERIVPAADGGLWFTLTCKSTTQLGHITTAGVGVGYSLPTNFVSALGLVVGKDGAVYIAGSDNSTGAILRATVDAAGNVTGTSIVDVGNTGDALQGIAQTADGDLWATTGQCSPSAYVRVHLSAGFVESSTSVIPTLIGCSVPTNPLALPDGSFWSADNSYSTVSQVIPNAENAPSIYDPLLPGAPTTGSDYWDVAVGKDGYIYATNFATGEPGFSNVVAKVAY